MRTLLIFILGCCLLSIGANAQNAINVSGTVTNAATNEIVPAASVVIKGTNIGTYTNDKGVFSISTSSQKLPFTIVISSVSYAQKEVVITQSGENLTVGLDVDYTPGTAIVVAATRVPERILESPVSIERVNSRNILNAPSENYYNALGNLKGVDITTSSYTFKTVSTRGFNGSGNLRFNQFVDGMDNTAPALNFSVGNVIGLTELDVDNMELLPGASSALYGSGGMNGTLLINSKDPFKYQGISFQVKQGVMHISDPRHSASPFYDWSLRWGKKLSDKFAFKIGAQYIKADDWQADDQTNLERNNVLSKIKSGTRESDPNYDGVNVYGDEASANMFAFSEVAKAQTRAGVLQATGGQFDILAYTDNYFSDPAPPTQDKIGMYLNDINTINPALTQTAQQYLPFYFGSKYKVYGSQDVSRTGYQEKDMVSYNSYNAKVSGGLYYKINNDIEASLTGNWGLGTSVYTGADRYALKNFQIGQYKLEFKSKNWLFRAYTTQENSGDSYATTLTALAINNAWKPNAQWFGEYVGNYAGASLMGAPNAQAHALARAAAEQGMYRPGTPEFNAAFDKAVTTSISEGGSQFADKSDLYQLEGQLNLSQYVKVVDVLVGGQYRSYHLDSKGTIFADYNGPINISEYGAYIQLQKAFLHDVLKLTAAGRYDKNENFDGRFTPRVTASVKVAKDNNIRFSYQQAYRFPNNQDQYINLKSPGSTLIGGLPLFEQLYHFSTAPVYTAASVVAYRAAFAASPTQTPDPSILKVAPFSKPKPESMQSFELGYRGIIAKKLLIDAYVYTSKYKDFIARVAGARGASGDAASSYGELLSPFTSENFSFVTNSTTDVKAQGWGIGGEYQLNKGYRFMANIYGDQLKDVQKDLITFFNTPKIRYNLGFSNANVYKGIGFNIVYKWQDKIYWEGTFGTGEIPAFGTMDAQVSYKLGKKNNLIKLGGTNIINHYYRNAFGNPYIGGLYYVSFGYNVF